MHRAATRRGRDGVRGTGLHGGHIEEMNQMSQVQGDNGDDRDHLHASPPFHFSGEEREAPAPFDDERELEPGWRAIRALMRLRSDELLAVMLRPSFRPVRDMDLVPVVPCPYCQDGGLRMAGSVRLRKGRAPVRACDTCAKLEIERKTKADTEH
jgi:hypothetical protein